MGRGAVAGAWRRHAPTGALGCRLSVVGSGVPVPQLVPGDLSLCLGCIVIWLDTPPGESYGRGAPTRYGLTCAVPVVRMLSAECGMFVGGTLYSALYILG